VRAAEALELKLKHLSPEAIIANYDVLTLMPPAFRKVYRDGYFKMVARTPRVLGWLYDATDKPFHHDTLHHQIERAGATKLLKTIREFDADVAICTHFLPTALLDRERRKGRSRARVITVVTDFEVHGMWLSAPSDHYFVATAEARHLKLCHRALSHHRERHSDSSVLRRKRSASPCAASTAGTKIYRHSGFRWRLRRWKCGTYGRCPHGCENPGSNYRGLRQERAAESIHRQNRGNERPDPLPLVKVIGFTAEMDERDRRRPDDGKPGGLTTSNLSSKDLMGDRESDPGPGREKCNLLAGAGSWRMVGQPPYARLQSILASE
jgi:processive 1,2-diacylglycerol beta-glucosyltransferase